MGLCLKLKSAPREKKVNAKKQSRAGRSRRAKGRDAKSFFSVFLSLSLIVGGGREREIVACESVESRKSEKVHRKSVEIFSCLKSATREKKIRTRSAIFKIKEMKR